MKAIVITGGYVNTDFIKGYLNNISYDYLLACDKGLEAVNVLNLSADLIVGDFDSVDENLIDRYEKNPKTAEAVMRFMPEKDYTDTHLAVEMAIKAGADEIIILGATGNRLDHVLGNIAVLSFALEQSVKAVIVDEFNRIFMMDDSVSIIANEQYGNYVSLIPYGGNVEGLTLSGFKYNVSNIILSCSESMGISNEIKDKIAKITIKKGKLIVIEAKQK